MTGSLYSEQFVGNYNFNSKDPLLNSWSVMSLYSWQCQMQKISKNFFVVILVAVSLFLNSCVASNVNSPAMSGQENSQPEYYGISSDSDYLDKETIKFTSIEGAQNFSKEIFLLKNFKAYDLLEKKLKEANRYCIKNENLLGILFLTMDLADFHSYAFINYRKSLSLYDKALKVNEKLQIKAALNSKNTGNSDLWHFYETHGKFTFIRDYNPQLIVKTITRKQEMMLSILGDSRPNSFSMGTFVDIKKSIETQPHATLDELLAPSMKNLPIIYFEEYRIEIATRLDNILKRKLRLNEKEKKIFYHFNIAKVLLKSFDIHIMGKQYVRQLYEHAVEALNLVENDNDLLTLKCYLYFIETVCLARLGDYTSCLATYDLYTKSQMQITTIRNQRLKEQKQGRRNMVLKGLGGFALGVAAIALDGGNGGGYNASGFLAGFGKDIAAFTVLGFRQFASIDRDLLISGESEYSKELNAFFNIDEQLLLFDALGKSFYFSGNTERSIFFNREAISIVNNIRETIETEDHRISYVKWRETIYNRLIDDLITIGNIHEAFEYSENSRSRAFVDLLATKKNLKFKNYATNSNIQKIKDKQLALYQLRKQTNIVNNQIEYLNSTVRGLVIKETKGKETEKGQVAPESLKASQQKIKLTAEEYSLVNAKTVSIIDIQNGLPQDSALIEYYISNKNIYVWVVEKSKFELVMLGVSPESLKKQHRKLLLLIKKSYLRSNEVNNDRLRKLSNLLYNKIFKPISSRTDKKNIFIVGHQFLHFMPFDVLHDGSSLLVEDYLFSYLPSASVINFLKLKPKSYESILALGNPDVTYSENVLPLIWAEKECQEISTFFKNAKVFIGNDATETNFLMNSGNYDIAHIASHGVIDSQQPMESRLLLADDTQNNGILTVSDLYGLDCNFSLVTLSACETGLSDVENGDELIGLLRGFFFAGSRSIIASLWKVDDKSTMELMIAFYSNLKNGKDVIESLQLAKNKIRAIGEFAHPYYWASFNHYGFLEENF